jgi:N-acetyl-alpha-D-muramate 1-phosphate uridylyltransferase
MTLPCLVLAGGLGTRMGPITASIPKALVAINGQPFVDLQLKRLAHMGVSDVVLSIGHLGALLRAHVGDGSALGVTARYVDEGERRLGTGGAVRFAVDSGSVDDAFFVLYGDSYLDVDFSVVETAWRASGRPALMTVTRNADRWAPSNAEYRGGLVTLYDKRQLRSSMRWIDYGLLVMTAAAVRQNIAPDVTTDLAGPLHRMSVRGDLAGHLVRRRFYEIGSPAGVRDLERRLRRQEIASEQPARARPLRIQRGRPVDTA